MRFYLIAITLLTLVLVACNQRPTKKVVDVAYLKQKVDEGNARLGQFFMSGNADSLANMYSVDAKLCPDGGEFVNGRENIRAYWRQGLKGGSILEMKTETLTIDGNEEVIYETGKTHLKISTDSTKKISVKYCNVWKLQLSGSYKLDVDIWNELP